MRIALAQIGSVPGDFAGIVDHMLETAERAERLGADLIVFPASLFGGVYPTGLGESRSFTLDMLDAIEDYAARTPLTSAVPAYVYDGEVGYTEVFLCEEGVAGPLRLRETHRPANEGSLPTSIVAAARVGGVQLQFLVGDTDVSSQDADTDVLVILSTLPFCDQDASSLLAPGLADGSLQGLVDECPCTMAMLQGVGGYDDAVLAGGSFAAAPDGTIVAACPSFEEGLVTFDVQGSPASADDVPGFVVSSDALGSPCRTQDPDAQAPACIPGVQALIGLGIHDVASLSADLRTEFLWKALVVAVRDYVRKSGFGDVLLGLSGGIDSSVTAAIAVDALGSEHVLGVLMPGPYSSEGSVTDAVELADNLGIQTRTVPIKAMYDAAAPLFAEALGTDFGGVAAENLQARLRGNTLMSLSNALSALVLNTGNKSEAGMGYSTLYGDTVGAFGPLVDVYKGRVYDLARWRNACGPLPVIPENVLVKSPSAELSPGQTDEGSFGVSYQDVDRVLLMHVERGMGAQEIVNAGVPAATVQRVLDACRSAEFKRRQEPMGPVVSLEPFIDRGWPVVLGWRDTCDDAARPDSSKQSPDAQTSFSDDDLDDLEVDGLDEDEAFLLDVDEDGVPLDDESVVAARLDQMTGRLAHQDQIVGMLGDVAYGSSVSGRGPDMDDVMGVPLFSKN